MLVPNNTKRTLFFALCFSIPVALVLFLFLFFFMRTNVSSVTLPVAGVPTTPSTEAPTNPPNSPKVAIVAFGDSITAGYGITLIDAYPNQLERALQDKGFSVKVVNSGVTGETTAGGLRRAEFVAAQKNVIVILALGGNDVLRGIDPDSTKKNLAEIIAIFTRAGTRVLLVVMYAPRNLGVAYVSKFNAIYPSLAEEFRVPLAPFLLEDVVFVSALNQDDGIHPNKAGARIVAEENILPYLLPLVKEVDSSR